MTDHNMSTNPSNTTVRSSLSFAHNLSTGIGHSVTTSSLLTTASSSNNSNNNNKINLMMTSSTGPGSSATVSAAASSMSDPTVPPTSVVEMEGWLHKWTNYIKGYRRRWFVLSKDGYLSYYRKPTDYAALIASTNGASGCPTGAEGGNVQRRNRRRRRQGTTTCRGNIPIANVIIHSEEDTNNIIISNIVSGHGSRNMGTTSRYRGAGGRGRGVRTLHLRAMNENDRERWVTALELLKARLHVESEEDDRVNNLVEDIVSEGGPKEDIESLLETLSTKLDDLKTYHDIVVKQSNSLANVIKSTIESILEQNLKNGSNNGLEFTELDPLYSKIIEINEQSTLFKMTISAMIDSNHDYLNMITTHGRRWQKLLQHEHETRLRLEEMIEQLAKQHSHLEQRAARASMSSTRSRPPILVGSGPSDGEDTTEFFDAVEEFFRRASMSSSSTGQFHSPIDEGSVVSSLTESPVLSITGRSVGRGTLSASTSRGSVSHERHETRSRSIVSDSLINLIDDLDGSDLRSRSRFDRKEDNHELRPKSIVRSRRISLPSPPGSIDPSPPNFWSFFKNFLGRADGGDISKISMPVKFNEPISMLQRVAEDFEYVNLLHSAAVTIDPSEQLVYVAAWCVSHYSNCSNRIRKPFNPLLGETFDYDRMDDLGFRLLVEQVSHHPPMLALHVEGRHGWKVWSEFSISSKFRGKSLVIEPNDVNHLEFESSGHHITWRKVTTTIHNVIVGKPWVDHHGEVSIMNHTTGHECRLKFTPYSYFATKEQNSRKVTGLVVNPNGNAEWILNGSWDDKLEASRVSGVSVMKKSDSHHVLNGSNNGASSEKVLNCHSNKSTSSEQNTNNSSSKIVWKKSTETNDVNPIYHLSLFAIQLNEPEDDVAPTDSRLRPDQRLTEQGHFDVANRVKIALEEKQRHTRRQREQEAERSAMLGLPYRPYEPIWFERIKDPIFGSPVYRSNDRYWLHKSKRDWSMCPDIFSYHDFLPKVHQSSSALVKMASASGHFSSGLLSRRRSSGSVDFD